MLSPDPMHLATWAAFLSAGATIATAATATLFLLKGEPFGTINDAASVIQALFTLGLAWALHGLIGREVPVLGAVAATIGTIDLLTVAALQALLVFRKVTFDQTFSAVLCGGAAMGSGSLS